VGAWRRGYKTGVAEGAGLDIEQPDALLAYLRRTKRIGAREDVEIEVLSGGVSNKTVLVERPSGEAWVLKQALPKLRVKVDWFSDPTRIEREAMALRWLPKLAPPEWFTPLVFEDRPHHLLAMQAFQRPHENFKSLLMEERLGLVQQIFSRFGALIGTIHRGAYDRRRTLARVFGDRSFFESLRLEPYYAYAAKQVPAARPFLDQLIDQTRRTRQTLVHGDYSPKNVLVTTPALRLVLLDHEVIHWGDPAFDVGFALTHLLSKGHHRRDVRPNLAKGADSFRRAYLRALGDVPFREGLEPRAVRHTLACLLARVAGRSPLEYLTGKERRRQQAAAVELMSRPPTDLRGLIAEFYERV
jgi:aminoglycoside phosphotransferase (APT) family kinase protein